MDSLITGIPGHYPRHIALTGYARTGKDKIGEVLVGLGYTRHAFGDIIKAQVSQAASGRGSGIIDVCRWVEANEDGAAETVQQIRSAYFQVASGTLDPYTEVDTEKAILRPLLERWGECFYLDIFNEYFDALPQNAVNTRLVRIREAQEWVSRGGVLWMVLRPGKGPETPWIQARMHELIRAGVITGYVGNTEGLDALAVNVARWLSDAEKSDAKK